MFIKREWATPFVIGGFLLSASTGISLFFRVNTELGQIVHEWLGPLFVIGALCHITVNFAGLKRHLQNITGRIIIGIYAIVIIAVFLPLGSTENPQGLFLNAAMNAPLKDLAVVVKRDPQFMLQKLQAAGVPISGTEQSIANAIPDNWDSRLRALGIAMHQ
jgi:hypothetical protein